MTDNLLTQDDAEAVEMQKPARPEHLPEKFWDAETGELRLDDLIRSYVALEQKLSAVTPRVPKSAEEYCVNCDHGMFTPDIDLNRRLHQGGFTQEQVQMVYDLAAEKMVPMILEIAGEFKADREVERLTAAFGGPEKWQEVARQLLAYGRKNLPGDVLENLSSSFEGVMMLHRMMTGEGGGMASPRVDTAAGASEDDLRGMMRDPRYWRQKDPAFVSRVTEGFRQIYRE